MATQEWNSGPDKVIGIGKEHCCTLQLIYSNLRNVKDELNFLEKFCKSCACKYCRLSKCWQWCSC